MNKDELKKKIMEVLNKNFTEEVECTPVYTTDDGKEIELPEELCEMFNDIVTQAVIPYFADALIAAGIGDVKIVREIGASAAAMAVFEAAKAEHRAEVAERALKHAVNVYIAHTETSSKKKWWYKYFLREAEKELEEERKE